MRSSIKSLVFAITLTFCLSNADDTSAHDHADAMFSAGAHVGVTVPQLFSELGSWPIFGLELGFIVPTDIGPFVRPLQISFDIMYTAPGASGEGSFPLLGEDGADYQWQLSQRMLILQLAPVWRFMPPQSFVRAYGLIGPRLYLMESVLEASQGANDFGENRETNTEVGLVVGGGAEFLVGPGAAFADLVLGISNLDQRITGDTNTGALALSLGYRFFF